MIAHEQLLGKMQDIFLRRLDGVLNSYDAMARSVGKGLSMRTSSAFYSAEPGNKSINPTPRQRVYIGAFTSAAITAIEDIAGPRSTYARRARAYAVKCDSEVCDTDSLAKLMGLVTSLRRDVGGGFLHTATDLIHGDLFNNFLDMADALLADGYKDPAAMMGGGVLEGHLRQLCTKNSIAVVEASGRPKRADTINADLTKKSVYSGLEQKQVTAWLDLRNKAAHARYGEYDANQVRLFLHGIRDFIVRHPA